MKCLSGFSDRKSQKSQWQGTLLSHPHTHIYLARAFQPRHRRSQPGSEEKSRTSHSTHHASESRRGEDPSGKGTIGGAESKGNFCSARGQCRAQRQTRQLLLCQHTQGKSCNWGSTALGDLSLPILQHWCKSTWRFRSLCSLPYAFH